MTTALPLLAGLILDAIFGEPGWLWSRLPHPAVLFGRAIGWLDNRLNRGDHKRLKGLCAVAVLVIGATLIGGLISGLGPVGETLAVAVLLAQKSLTEHVTAVASGLRRALADGRQAVSMIVSRNTDAMTEPQVARAALESAAENLSDGVIAPAFWFLIAGAPGLVVYKAINTADSMIGYRNARYADFGWAAARLDDLVNLIPARLTALMIALIGRQMGQWSAITADARRHKSPNAGWPEAAFARSLNLALAGPRSYDGKMQELAWVNHGARTEIGPPDIDAGVRLLWQVWGLGLAITLAIALV